jgi:HAE1 family hydrophobic/amphiphilic exporter-1
MQKLADICVRRPVFATMLILSLTVVGLFSYNSLGVDLFPKIDLPTITVTIVNPGASPQEIETEITDRVEGTVNTISGIDELRSTSVEGVSQVFITFLLEKIRRRRTGSSKQGRFDRERSSGYCREANRSKTRY